VQGNRPDGTERIRACDDESANGLNEATYVAEKLYNEQIDQLLQLVALLWELTGDPPAFWKADVDAAYRRLPVRPDDRYLLWVVIECDGVQWASQHLCAPFGATASVHAWHVIGALIQHLAISILFLPVLRYVDDFYAAERQELADHAAQCFARLCRMLLGSDSLKDAKIASGSPLTILGITIRTTATGVDVWPDPDKVTKWSGQIQRVDEYRRLQLSLASKIAGRLNFAAQYAHLKIGKAALTPIYRQQYSPLPGNRVSNLLLSALKWWQSYLSQPMRKSHVYGHKPEHIHVFTDARSTPPRLAAVLLHNGELSFADAPPLASVIDQLDKRDDQQIMALEMIAAFFGISTFAETLRGKHVHLWIGNSSGEAALRTGSSRATDHNALAHQLRVYAAELGIAIDLHRVPSALNISDLPSREAYAAPLAHGAVRVAPIQPPISSLSDFCLAPSQSPSSPAPPLAATTQPVHNTRHRKRLRQ
jgi:hypothetical protein